jgi:hypothetical protein
MYSGRKYVNRKEKILYKQIEYKVILTPWDANVKGNRRKPRKPIYV